MARKIASLLLFVSVFWAASPALGCSVSQEEFPTHSNYMVEFKIGDQYFRFPESFFYHQAERLPGKRESVRIRVALPQFAAPSVFPKAEPYTEERRNWDREHPSLGIVIRTPGKFPSVYYHDKPADPLTEVIEIQYDGDISITPSEIHRKLLGFMSETPSATWEENHTLAEKLTSPRPISPVACGAMNSEQKAPPSPPLIAMEIINRGLLSQSQAIRSLAVQQLARYENDVHVIDRLYEVAEKDPQYDVRMEAARALARYKSSEEMGPRLYDLMQKETNERVIEEIGTLLIRHRKDLAPLALKSALNATGQKRYENILLLVWSINDEIQEKKLTEYSQLSVVSKLALGQIMDFYEHTDVPEQQKEEVSSRLQNNSAVFATSRYVDLMVKRRAISELGYLNAEPDKVIPVLISELKSNRIMNYSDTSEALGRYRSQAKEALPYLLPLLHFSCPSRDPNTIFYPSPYPSTDPTRCESYMVHSIKGVTANAIGDIGIATPEVLQALYDALEHDRKLCYNAGNALLKLEQNRDTIFQAFDSILDKNGSACRFWIIEYLGNSGEQAKPLLPKLKKMLAESGGTDQGLRYAVEKISGEELAPIPQETENK